MGEGWIDQEVSQAFGEIARLVGLNHGYPAQVVDRVRHLVETPLVGGTRTPVVGDLITGTMKIEDGAMRTATIRPTTPDVTFEYVGDGLAEPDYDGPIPKSVYSCTGCGSLVVSETQADHKRWHDRVGLHAEEATDD